MTTALLAVLATLLLPTAASPRGEVAWRVSEDATPKELTFRFGISERRLTRLNPDLAKASTIAAGTAVTVFGREDTATRSIGWPHDGRLQNGAPMPEGDAWRLRDTRRRAWGSAVLVDTLVTAFERYGKRFPDGPPVRVGELSRRKGGELKPHKSHRSGRDVDLGYILLGEDDGTTAWKSAKPETLDAEKTWFLLESLVATGNVEVIFVSMKVQRALRAYAVEHVPKDVRAKFFLADAPDASDPVWLRHQNGHRDHLHLRVRCGAGSPRCRSTGVWPDRQ